MAATLACDGGGLTPRLASWDGTNPRIGMLRGMSLDLSADLVPLLRTITDIESVSGNEEHLADLVYEALSELDHLTVERDGDAVVARTFLGRPSRVLIAGHLDTVPVANNLPSWEQNVDGEDRVYGRGTCDMKGGVAVLLKAAAAVKSPAWDVTWVFYDHEEVSGDLNGLGRIAREKPEWLAADFAVLGEPSNATIEGGCQGTMRFKITTVGVAAHSARAWLGHNAVHDMAEVLTRLAEYEPRVVQIEGLTYTEGLNAVRIAGGLAGNVLPDKCTVEINFRFAPDRTTQEATEYMREVFTGHDLEIVDLQPGARPGLDHPIAAQFVAAVGGTPSAKDGWTDVARFSALGIPAVNFGPANPGKAHSDDEFCPVADLTKCYAALTKWLEASAND